MIYHLLTEMLPGVKYITFRAAFGSVTAFLVSILFGPVIIWWLRNRQVTERTDKVHSDKLADLHEEKQETPSMGGLFLVGGTVAGSLLFCDLTNPLVLTGLFVTISLWLLGFVDDWIKLHRSEQHGIQVMPKLIVQILVGLGAGTFLYYQFQETNPELTKLYVPVVSSMVSIGPVYPFLVALVIVSTSNAVNLSDGLDGLAIGLAVMVALVYAVISYVTGRIDFSEYLNIPFVRGAGELSILMTSLVGGGLGFLWYNCHPAQIFMGNTGSLPVGGLIGIVAVISKQELVLILTGGVFVMEAISVALQVFSYKLRKERIFEIAPIHHHFEFKGWSESKIVIRFWILATIFAILSLALLKL